VRILSLDRLPSELWLPSDSQEEVWEAINVVIPCGNALEVRRAQPGWRYERAQRGLLGGAQLPRGRA